MNKILCPNSITIPNQGYQLIPIKLSLDFHEELHGESFICKPSEFLIEKNLIIINNVITIKDRFFNIKLFNLNKNLETENPMLAIVNLMSSKNMVKIDEGCELFELIRL